MASTTMKRSGGGLFGGSKIKKYSFDNAKLLCDEVTRLEALKSEELVDTLRELVEVVVWGDKHEEDIFDLFLERNMLENFAVIFCDEEFAPTIRVQVVQCVTILFQNLTRQSSSFFLLSGDRVNRMISATFDVTDEEIISNYVSFIKTLSLRLDGSTVQFFFNNNQLPLFSEAIGLLGHDDRMVRTSARSIVVNVLQLTEPNVVEYILGGEGAALIDTLLGYATAELSAIDRSFAAISDFTPKSSQLPLSFAASATVSRAATPQADAVTKDGEVAAAAATSTPPVEGEGVKEEAASQKDANADGGGEEIKQHPDEPDAKNPSSSPNPSAAAVLETAGGAEASAPPSVAPTSLSPQGGGVQTPLPSSVMQLDAAIEDLVDDFYYYNDLMGIENKEFTVLLFNRLQEVVAGTLLNPVSQSGAGGAGGRDVLSLDLRLLMLSHWIRVNTIPALQPLLLYVGFALEPIPLKADKEEKGGGDEGSETKEEVQKAEHKASSPLDLMDPLPPLPLGGTPLVLQGLLQVEGSGASHRTYAIALNLVSTAAKARTTRPEEKAHLLDTKPVTTLMGEGSLRLSSSSSLNSDFAPTLTESNVVADAVLKAVFSIVSEPCLLRLNTLQLGLSILSQLPIDPKLRFENVAKVSTKLQHRLRRRLETSANFFDSLLRGGSGNSTVIESAEPEDGRETSEELVFQELRCGVPESRETLSANEVFFSIIEQHMTVLLPGLVAPSQNTAIEKVGRESSAMVPLFPPFRRLSYYGALGTSEGGANAFDPLMMHNLSTFGCQGQPTSPARTEDGTMTQVKSPSTPMNVGVTMAEYNSRAKKYTPERTTTLGGRVAANPREQETVDFMAFLLSRHCIKSKFFKKRTASEQAGGLPSVDSLLEDAFQPFTTNLAASFRPAATSATGESPSILPHYKTGDVVNTTELSHLATATAAAQGAAGTGTSPAVSEKKRPSGTAPAASNDSGVRCEYAPAPADLLPQPVVGSVLYAYFVGSQMLLVQPDKSVIHKGTVAFAVPLLYTEAMVNVRHGFRLTLEQNKPLKLAPNLKHMASGATATDDKQPLRVGLALRDRKACQNLSKRLHASGKDLRDQASVLAKRIVREEISMEVLSS